MKYTKFLLLMLLGLVVLGSACEDDEPCLETTWYEDMDGDGLGNPAVSQLSCDQPDGYVADNSDTKYYLLNKNYEAYFLDPILSRAITDKLHGEESYNTLKYTCFPGDSDRNTRYNGCLFSPSL